jgi:hypothetical protein
MMRSIVMTAVAAGVLAWAAPASAAPTLQVFPDSVNLQTARDYQSVVVQLVQDDGITRDVTAEAAFTLADPNLAKLENKNVLTPAADGATTLSVQYKDLPAVSVPVTVKEAKTDRPISFKLDVMPVFLRSGCNSGSCHGAARGKDGFRLSLFGYDPDGDYHRLTREIATRRINLALPAESLMIQKSTGQVPHTGGALFKPDSELCQPLMRWLEAGAPQDSASVAKPISLEILPKTLVLEGEGATQRMTARAKYSDGTDRDVTHLALFLSNNDNSAKINPDGVVTAGKTGEAFIMARFATFTVGSQAIVIPKDLKYTWPNPTENNFVDTLVNNKLKKLRITPSELCSDEVYLRRAYVDVIGRLPTPEQYAAFMADTSSNKREKLIDELLSRKEFVEVWVMKFAELLQIRSTDNQTVSYKAALLYYNWLQEKLSANVPMNKIVQELLGANGGTFKNPAANYYQVTTEQLLLAENTAQVFMGMRIQCAQCHNHPFDRWTQNEYYQFAAFFSQIGRKQAEDPRETIVFNSGGGETAHPVSGAAMKPKFLGGEEPDTAGKDRRVVLAEWLASPKNPYFAKNLANIVWAHFFGKGIIDPVDDVRISNPAVNPELLEALGTKFQEYNYDFKRLVKDICTSQTYQLATEANKTNEQDSKNFSHALVRRIRAEVLLDCITQITETKDKFPGLPLGARAVQIANGQTSTYFLTTFGRATRETACSCEVKMDPNLSQALHLLNGDTTNAKVRGSEVIKKMVEAKPPVAPEKMIEDLYVRSVSRKPTKDEVEKIKAMLPADKPAEQKQVLEDVFWALLNSQEFMFNH